MLNLSDENKALCFQDSVQKPLYVFLYTWVTNDSESGGGHWQYWKTIQDEELIAESLEITDGCLDDSEFKFGTYVVPEFKIKRKYSALDYTDLLAIPIQQIGTEYIAYCRGHVLSDESSEDKQYSTMTIRSQIGDHMDIDVANQLNTFGTTATADDIITGILRNTSRIWVEDLETSFKNASKVINFTNVELPETMTTSEFIQRAGEFLGANARVKDKWLKRDVEMSNGILRPMSGSDENLIDASLLIDGYMSPIDANTILLPTANKEKTTAYIPVYGGCSLTFNTKVTIPNTGYLSYKYHFFDENQQPIGNEVTEHLTTLKGYQDFTVDNIAVPDGAYYIRFSNRMYDDGVMSLVNNGSNSLVAAYPQLEFFRICGEKIALEDAVDSTKSLGSHPEYKRLQYIDTDGGAYFNTGVTDGQDTAFKYKYSEEDVLGHRQHKISSNTLFAPSNVDTNGTNAIYVHKFGGDTYIANVYGRLKDIRAFFGYGNEVWVNQYYQLVGAGTISSTSKLYLNTFQGAPTNSSYWSRGKMFYAQIYNKVSSDSDFGIIADMIPVVSKDGQIGMYDIKRLAFYPSETSKSFVAPPALEKYEADHFITLNVNNTPIIFDSVVVRTKVGSQLYYETPLQPYFNQVSGKTLTIENNIFFDAMSLNKGADATELCVDDIAAYMESLDDIYGETLSLPYAPFMESGDLMVVNTDPSPDLPEGYLPLNSITMMGGANIQTNCYVQTYDFEFDVTFKIPKASNYGGTMTVFQTQYELPSKHHYLQLTYIKNESKLRLMIGHELSISSEYYAEIVFPACPQEQVINLHVSYDGTTLRYSGDLGIGEQSVSVAAYQDVEEENDYNRIYLGASSLGANYVTIYDFKFINRHKEKVWNDIFNDGVHNHNLIAQPYQDSTKTVNGVTYTLNSDGSLTLNGTSLGVSPFVFNHFALPVGKYYWETELPQDCTWTLGGVTGGLGATGTYNVTASLAQSDSYWILNVPRVGITFNDVAIKQPKLYRENTPSTLLQLDFPLEGEDLAPEDYSGSSNALFTFDSDGDITVNAGITADNSNLLTMYYFSGSAVDAFKGKTITLDVDTLPYYANVKYQIDYYADDGIHQETDSNFTIDFPENLQFLVFSFGNTNSVIGTTQTFTVKKPRLILYKPQQLRLQLASKNLIPYPYSDTTKTVNGITFTDNGDGSVTISGTASDNAYFNLQRNADYGTQPINAINKNSATNGVYTASSRIYYNAVNKTVTINIPSGTTLDETVYPQVELGTTPTAYTPYISDFSTVNVTRCGKNLTTPQQVYKGATAYSEEIFENKNCVRFSSSITIKNSPVAFKPNTQYTVSFDVKTVLRSGQTTSGADDVFRFFYSDGTSSGAANIYTNTEWTHKVLTSIAGKTILYVGVTSAEFRSYSYVDINSFQLEEGSTATAYEPYQGQTASANETGAVSGITSLYPLTTLMANNAGALMVEVEEYDGDILKTVESDLTPVFDTEKHKAAMYDSISGIGRSIRGEKSAVSYESKKRAVPLLAVHSQGIHSMIADISNNIKN